MLICCLKMHRWKAHDAKSNLIKYSPTSGTLHRFVQIMLPLFRPFVRPSACTGHRPAFPRLSSTILAQTWTLLCLKRAAEPSYFVCEQINAKSLTLILKAVAVRYCEARKSVVLSLLLFLHFVVECILLSTVPPPSAPWLGMGFI